MRVSSTSRRTVPGTRTLVADGRRRALHSPAAEKEHHKPAEPRPHHDTHTDTASHSKPPQDGPSIQSLLNMAHILYDPIRIPRYPIVLCHGLYGFAVKGPRSFPKFQIHYWGKLLEILSKKLGAKVVIGAVPPTGTIAERAAALDGLLTSHIITSSTGHRHPNNRAPPQFNFIAHSMGGLDARYLISHINPKPYTPVSLTTICTPHRGSPFMDWCRANIGVGMTRSTGPATRKEEEEERGSDSGREEARIPFSLKEPLLKASTTTAKESRTLRLLLLSLVDSPAYANLNSGWLAGHFNPSTPDRPGVQYFSVAARIPAEGLHFLHALYLPSLLMNKLTRSESSHPSTADQHDDQFAHDGLVTVPSARWGTFLGTVRNTDHWEIRGSSSFGYDLGGGTPEFPSPTTNNNNWLELNKYINSWISSSSNNNHHDNSHLYKISSDDNPLLSNWISKKLLKTLIPSSSESSLAAAPTSISSTSFSNQPSRSSSSGETPINNNNPTRTVHPGFPLDDLDISTSFSSSLSSKKNQFDLELFYLAVCRNLYDHGL